MSPATSLLLAHTVPIEQAAPAVAAAVPAFVGSDFQLLTDFTTGQAFTFASMLYLLARFGTFFPCRVGAVLAAAPPAAPQPIAPPFVALWDAAVSGP